MSKIFDYKFLIILGLSLVVYFLYREVDFLNKRVAKLETNTIAIDKPKPQMIDLPPPPAEDDENISSTIEDFVNNNEEIDNTTNNNFRKSSERSSCSSPKSSPKQSSPKQSSPKQSSPKQSSSKQSSSKQSSSKRSSPKRSSPKQKSTIDIIIDRTIAETLHQSNDNKLDNAIRKSTVNNNDEMEDLHGNGEELHGTVEEYSNENINVENIYSHDGLDSNTLDNDSLMVDSIVNMVKDNDICEIQKTKQTVESLTKLKLDELQEMATKLNININTENGKKKKKADLASEIYNKTL